MEDLHWVTLDCYFTYRYVSTDSGETLKRKIEWGWPGREGITMPVTRSSMSVSVSEKEAAMALLALKSAMKGAHKTYDYEINGKLYEVKNYMNSGQTSKRPKRGCAVYTPGMYAESDD